MTKFITKWKAGCQFRAATQALREQVRAEMGPCESDFYREEHRPEELEGLELLLLVAFAFHAAVGILLLFRVHP